MKYKMSGHLNCPTSRFEEAAEWYTRVLGLEEGNRVPEHTHLVSGPLHLYFDKDDSVGGPIFEFIVPDLEAAKSELVSAGCTVLKWGGLGQPNYIRDPFGFVFNIFEEKEAF